MSEQTPCKVLYCKIKEWFNYKKLIFKYIFHPKISNWFKSWPLEGSKWLDVKMAAFYNEWTFVLVRQRIMICPQFLFLIVVWGWFWGIFLFCPTQRPSFLLDLGFPWWAPRRAPQMAATLVLGHGPSRRAAARRLWRLPAAVDLPKDSLSSVQYPAAKWLPTIDNVPGLFPACLIVITPVMKQSVSPIRMQRMPTKLVNHQKRKVAVLLRIIS